MTKDARFDMRMPSDVVRDIKDLASKDNRSTANYVEVVLREHIAAKRKGKHR